MICSIRLDLLDVLGDDYIVQHLMNAYKEKNEAKLFRTYVTNSLYCMMHGLTLSVKYSELAGNEESEQPKESEEDIKERMISGLNNFFGKGGSDK